MNFLELTKRLCRECGVNTANLTTVVSQSGEALRMVDWLNAAWMDIQGKHHDWGWLRASTSFATVAGQATYTPAQAGVTNFGSWVRDSFKNYPTATGTDAEVEMGYIGYDAWRHKYQLGSARTATSQPYEFTITPAKAIGLGPVPAAGYTVTADYFASPTEMSLDADIPSLPTHYHLAIVYRAMMMYGAFEAAAEVYQRGEMEYTRLMRRMENDRLPEIMLGEPLC